MKKIQIMSQERLNIWCECGNPDHQFTFIRDKEDGDVYLTVHLKPNRTFWGRIKRAIGYIFGKRSRYGDFDEIIIDDEEYERLRQFFNNRTGRPSDRTELHVGPVEDDNIILTDEVKDKKTGRRAEVMNLPKSKDGLYRIEFISGGRMEREPAERKREDLILIK